MGTDLRALAMKLDQYADVVEQLDVDGSQAEADKTQVVVDIYKVANELEEAEDSTLWLEWFTQLTFDLGLPVNARREDVTAAVKQLKKPTIVVVKHVRKRRAA
ncbi:MAG: hypothetical protein WC683_19530 [bacterium]|jgi:hypothetical protein